VTLSEVFLKGMSVLLEECRLGAAAGTMFLNEDRDDVAFLTGSGSSKYNYRERLTNVRHKVTSQHK
jgi:hypothetical protein